MLTLSRNCPAKLRRLSAALSTLSSRPVESAGVASAALPLGSLDVLLGEASVRRMDEGGRNGASELSLTSEKMNRKYSLSTSLISCSAAAKPADEVQRKE